MPEPFSIPDMGDVAYLLGIYIIVHIFTMKREK